MEKRRGGETRIWVHIPDAIPPPLLNLWYECIILNDLCIWHCIQLMSKKVYRKTNNLPESQDY